MEKLYSPTEEDNKLWDERDGPAKDAHASQEYARYTTTRSDLLKAEGEAEKNFDTILLTISSVAIAASFTLIKDVVKGTNGWIIVSWILLGICLVGSLIDRLYTYHFHREWKDCLDDVFKSYREHCGHAWKEAEARLNGLRVRKIWKFCAAQLFLDKIKWVNSFALVLGLVAMMVYIYVGANAQPQITPTTAPAVTVNVYNSSTQPTINKSP